MRFPFLCKGGVSMKIRCFLCFLLSFLLLLFLPLTAFFSVESSLAYAFEATIDDAAAKYVLPVAAYMLIRMENSLQGISDTASIAVNAVQKKIDELSANSAALMRSIPKQSKAIIAKTFTDMTTEQINTALGTTYTDLELDSLSAEVRAQRQAGTFGSTYKDLYDIGIGHMFASSVKSLYNFSNSYGDIYDDTLSRVYVTNTSSKSGYAQYPMFVLKSDFNYDFFSFFGVAYLFNELLWQNNSYYVYSDVVAGKFKFSYQGRNYCYRPDQSGFNIYTSFTDSVLQKINFPGNGSNNYGGNAKVEVSYYEFGIWQTIFSVESKQGNGLNANVKLKDIIDAIYDYTNVDLRSTSYYTDDLDIRDIMNLTYQGYKVLSNDVYSVPLNIPALDSGFWGEDVSETAAERVTGVIGISSATWDVDVGTNTRLNDDPDTNEDIPYVTDVVLSPSTELDLPDVDTSVDPDAGSGSENPPITDIPILGDLWSLLKAILDWLKGLLEALKNLLLSLFIPSAGFFTNYFNNLKNFIGERLGLLYYPIELLILFANSYMNIPDSGSIVIDVPALQVNIQGIMYTFFPAYTFDFNSVFGMSAFAQLRQAYLVVVDVIVVFGLVYLLSKKANEVFKL